MVCATSRARHAPVLVTLARVVTLRMCCQIYTRVRVLRPVPLERSPSRESVNLASRLALLVTDLKTCVRLAIAQRTETCSSPALASRCVLGATSLTERPGSASGAFQDVTFACFRILRTVRCVAIILSLTKVRVSAHVLMGLGLPRESACQLTHLTLS